tara:strand:+ start:666 stop:1172 length:507 start_codon:yes stop_codon:yes gene_type:complete
MSIDNKDSENLIVEKVVKINRVNKVVKGGKRLAFRSFVVCGDKNGNVGIGLGKAKEVPIAIKKAIDKAKKSFVKINILDGTIPHEVAGKYGASRVIIKPAGKGTGVIAGGALRDILEALGVKNVVGKSYGSRNPINLALASIKALSLCKSLKEEEAARGIKISYKVKV